MADSTSENIGGINVSIDGDYSPLVAAFSTAQDLAQQAGADIADALVSGAEGAGDIGDTISTQLDEIGPSAEEATGGLNDFSGAAEQAGEGAETAGNQLAELAEQMAAVGEALVITEGMTELGTEALGAADSITHASIALSTMSGDAGEAKETIEGLEQLGMADGLAMPSLLTAAQRMTAILPDGTDVVSLLGQIADGAAVMGTNIDQAANMFDRLVSQGSASARTLTQLGLSLESLSSAFNVVTGGANSTADTVAAMFKALDDQGRIAVLQNALSNLGGTAQQVAEQTFGGQWQQLANEWEAVMVQAGQVLLPVISDLTDFAKTDVLPFIESLVADFKALPEPLQYAASAVVILTAAIVPVTGLLAAAAIGFNGLTTAAETLGLTSAATAEEIAAVGTAAAAATPEVAGLAEAEEVGGAGAAEMGGAMSLAATGGVLALAGALGSLVGAYEAWRVKGEQTAAQNQQLLDSVSALSTALQKHGIDVQGLLDEYNNGAISLTGLQAALQKLDGEYQDSVTKLQSAANNTVLLSGALKTLTDETQKSNTAYQSAVAVYAAVQQSFQTGLPLYKDHVATLADLTQATEDLVSAAGKVPAGMAAASTALANLSLAAEKAQLAYQADEAAYQSLLSAANAGNATWGQVEAAYAKVTASETAMAAAGVPVAGSLAAITLQANTSVDGITKLVSAQQLATDQTTAQADGLTSLSAQVVVSQEKLDLLVQEQSKLQQQVQSGQATQQQFNTLLGQIATAANEAQSKLFALQTATANQGNAAAIAGGETGVLKQALIDANLQLDQATTKANEGAISITAWASAQKNAVTAAANLAEAAAESASGMKGATDATDVAGTSAAGAAGKLQALTQAYRDGKASVSDYTTAQNAALTAKIAFDQQNAIQQTGLQGATDSFSLLTIQVAAAQAKYDDLKAAWQQGLPVQDQLISAQSDLTTKQNQLNAAVAAAQGPLANSTSGMQANTGAANNQAAALNTVTTAYQNMGNAATTAAAQAAASASAISSAISQLTTAFGSGGTSGNNTLGSAFGAPAGYGTSFGTNGTGEVINFYPYPETQMALDLKAALQNADISSNPNKSTSQASVDAQALAEAIATLKIDEQFYGDLSSKGTQLVTPAQLQSAQQAVATAQAALTALGAAATVSAGSTSAQGGVVVDPTQLGNIFGTTSASTDTNTTATATNTAQLEVLDAQVNQANEALQAAQIAFANGSGTEEQLQVAEALAQTAQAALDAAESGSTASSSTATTATAATSSGSLDTSAYGGTYPGVVAHQAAGEVWVVGTSGVAATGSSTASVAAAATSTSTSTTDALAASSTAATVQTAATTMKNVVGALQNLTDTVAAVTAQAAATKKGTSVSTGVINVSSGSTTSAASTSASGSTGSTNVSTGTINTSGSNGYLPTSTEYQQEVQTAEAAAAAAGVPWDGSVPWDGFTNGRNIPTASVPSATSSVSAPAGGGAASALSSVTLNIDMRNAMVGSAAQLQSQIAQAVTQSLTNTLFANGARLTR